MHCICKTLHVQIQQTFEAKNIGLVIVGQLGIYIMPKFALSLINVQQNQMSIQPKYSSMITKSLSFTSVPTSHNTSTDASRASMACIWCHDGEIMLYTLNLHFQQDIYFSALHIAIATTSGFQPFTITMKSAHTSTKRTDTKY